MLVDWRSASNAEYIQSREEVPHQQWNATASHLLGLIKSLRDENLLYRSIVYFLRELERTASRHGITFETRCEDVSRFG